MQWGNYADTMILGWMFIVVFWICSVIGLKCLLNLLKKHERQQEQPLSLFEIFRRHDVRGRIAGAHFKK